MKKQLRKVLENIGSIYEKDIVKFCSQCDFFCKEDHGCLKSTFDQPKYVLRGWCTLAEVKGKEVKMTKKGFFPRHIDTRGINLSCFLTKRK